MQQEWAGPGQLLQFSTDASLVQEGALPLVVSPPQASVYQSLFIHREGLYSLYVSCEGSQSLSVLFQDLQLLYVLLYSSVTASAL